MNQPPGQKTSSPTQDGTISLLQRLRSQRWLRVLMQAMVFVSLLLGIRWWQQRGVVQGTAPPLTGVTLEGEPLDLATYRGEPLTLHFWGSWCAVCRAEQPNILSLSEKHPVVTVASFSGDAAEVGAYLQKHPLGAPTVADPKGELARRYNVGAYPTTFVLDAEGEIKHVAVGYTSELGLRMRMWLAGL